MPSIASRRFMVTSSLVTSAPAAVMTNLATVKAELGLTTVDADRDGVLTRYLSACSVAIESYCNRSFAPSQARVDTFLPINDTPSSMLDQGLHPLQLTEYPVISVASVTENGAPLQEGADFIVDAPTGLVSRLDQEGNPCRWQATEIVVTYTAGDAIPTDVVDACIEFVKFRYFARTRDPGVTRVNVPGVYEASYLWGTGPGGPGDLPAAVEAKISRYRVPVVA